MKRRPGMHITPARLRKAGACNGIAAKVLRRKFPNGVRATAKMCEQYANARGFAGNWNWAGTHLLNSAGMAEFVRLRDALGPVRFKRPWIFGSVEQNGISDRAYNYALASIFGGLAEQRRYDPEFTPDVK